MNKIEPGLFSIPFDEYQSIEAINNSVLSSISALSPAHARICTEPTAAFVVGGLFHTMVLEPENLDRYAASPNFDKRTKAGKEAFAEFEEQNAGKEIVSESDWNTCFEMAKSVREHPIASGYLVGGRAEQSAIWEIEGQLCKGRIDYLNHCIVDLKSTTNAHPDSFRRSIETYRYPQQLAFYHDGIESLLEMDCECVIIACEKTPPYAVTVFQFSRETLERGRADYQAALEKYMKCLITDSWPAYPAEVNYI